ncbi:ATP-binding protein [Streptomyces virginiae]|uniref:ATP-binding protein n=1 Tax=Streptomyces virginiae TaxID=1961 RepID=UPI00380B2445
MNAAARHWHYALGPDSARTSRPGMSCTRNVLESLHGHGSADGSDGRRDDVLLVMSELLANACQHASGPTCIDISLDDSRLTVAVTDQNPAQPLPQPCQPGEPHGYGLHIVDRLATDWGVTPVLDGKTVWATLPAP